MKSFKVFALTLSLLALLAANVQAQCSGKTIYIQLPEDWGANTYIRWQGPFIKINGTKQGNWTVFTIPALSSDYGSGEIVFSNYNSDFNSGGIYYINKNVFGYSNSLNSNNGFPCSQFSEEGTYIMEDLATPGKTYLSAGPPDAKYFYFLPPNTQDWIGGIPYIADRELNIKNMEIAPGMCGWYRLTYFNEEAPSYMVIGIGPKLRSVLPAINLAEKFGLGNEIYFNAEGDIWSPLDPGINEAHRCQYTMAAIIYDTDPSVHPDFSCGIYELGINQGNGADSRGPCAEDPPAHSGAGGNLKPNCTGVVKGLVKKELNPDTRKIEYSGVDPKGCWSSKEWFDKAFTYTKGTNVQHCFDMPFGKQNNGFWEFDSDKWLNANGLLIGGFFPEVLHNAPDDPDCPSCNKKRTADSFVPLVKEIPANVFENYNSWEGDFKNGDIPTLGTILGTSSTGGIYDWSARDALKWYLHGTTVISNSYGNYYTTYSPLAKANEHFCFESHASFKYDPAQEFYFKGDDDIWVYINNQLVVDLGGAHMSAPGNVKLKNITPALEIDKEYPIDIFFCDRRTTQSNIRIKSNIYFGQTAEGGGVAGLFLRKVTNGDEICLRGGANTCAGMVGGGAVTICGIDLASQISYKMVIPGFDEFSLSDNPSCQWNSPTQGVCYGGIEFNDGVVTINEANIPSGIKQLGFELYASVNGYSPLNISKADATPIIAGSNLMLQTQEPKYYTLKGEPLGSKKPSKFGVYIMRQGMVSKTVVVK
jgi:fibro-slime domain-containing protein